MKTYLNQISGIDDAIVSMFMSKRSWTREKELHIREVCRTVLRADGGLREYDSAQADYIISSSGRETSKLFEYYGERVLSTFINGTISVYIGPNGYIIKESVS